MGIKVSWETTDKWIRGAFLPLLPVIAASVFVAKWPEIPILQDYRKEPEESFWDSFPSAELPVYPESRIRVSELRRRVKALEPEMTVHQRKRAERACRDLIVGADACQRGPLPSLIVPNCSSAYDNGPMLTDKIATWVNCGFVAGPFKDRPLRNMRANPLMAVERNNSIRPVINMSAPAGRSFNDNVQHSKLEKVYMATAQSFSYSLVEAGRFAVFSKFDLKDAYKNVPARMADWCLQAFRWLGRWFIELKEVFGAVTSVCNFDRVANTVTLLAAMKAAIPWRWIHRCLDDIVVVGPASSGYSKRFGDQLVDLCKNTNVLLADICPKNEKSFMNQTEGVVLGIRFNSRDMEWSLPSDKADDLTVKLLAIVNSESCGLKQMQKALGSVNHLAQMCPFVKAFRSPANEFVSRFNGSDMLMLEIPQQVKADFCTILRISMTAREGLPIPMPIPEGPSGVPLFHLRFISDAAGSSYSKQNGVMVATNLPNDRGVASLGLDPDLKVWYKCIARWPISFISRDVDSKGCKFGSKTTTLEAVGLLLPFITVTKILKGRHVVLEVENTGVVHSMRKRSCTKDMTAAIIVRAIHVISFWLGCVVHVVHTPRDSTAQSVLADRLSRRLTTASCHLEAIREADNYTVPSVLLEWLENPLEDWKLVERLLDHVIANS